MSPRSRRGRHRRHDVRWLQFGFSIAGTQKSGTSSLSALLDEHPQVKRAPKKEMHFFDDERRRWGREDYRDYRVTTRGRHTTVGDATPLYLWWPPPWSGCTPTTRRC